MAMRSGGLRGSRAVTVPIVATFAMVAWDVAMDPVWSTVVKAWIWRDGGMYFGVPLSNFRGWVITVFLIYQLFAISLRRRADRSTLPPIPHWRLAVTGYAITAGGNLLLLLPNSRPATVADATGRIWNVAEIAAATAMVSIFAMGAFAVVAWVNGSETEERQWRGSGNIPIGGSATSIFLTAEDV